MHAILKAQLREATSGSGQTSTLDVGRLLEVVSDFYLSLDTSDTSINEALDIKAMQTAPPSPTDSGPAVTIGASNSGLHERFADLRDDDLRAVLDSVADIVLTIDARGLIQFSNRVAVKFLDKAKRTLAGRNIGEFLPGIIVQGVDAFIAPFIAELDDTNPDFVGGEVRGKRADGEKFHVEMTISRLSAMAAGEHVICMRDISARAAAERALRENEERYRALVEHAPDAILVFDVETNSFIDANENACELFNLPRKRLLASGFPGFSQPTLGKTLTEADKQTAQQISTHIARALKGGQPVFEWLYTDGSKNQLPCEIRLSRLPAVDRSLVRVSVHSIAARKRRELVTYGENKVLEMIASGVEFEKILRALCRTAERVLPGSRATVMLADPKTGELKVAAAPSFNEKQFAGVAPIKLEHPELSCGVALATARPVIMTDVLEERAFQNYQSLVKRLQINSAWSFPVPSDDVMPLGTIDLYFTDKREPVTDEFDWLSSLARLAGIAVARERSQLALRQSEGRFRGLFENVVEGVYIGVPGGRLVAANPALVKMLGYSSEQDLVANSSRESIYVSDSDVARFVREMDQHGEIRSFEATMRRKDGSEIVVLENSRAVTDDDGSVHYEGTVADISERKRAERRVFEEKERAEVTLKSIGDGVITTDAHGCIVYLNPVAEDLTGWSLRAVRGRAIEEVLTMIGEHTRELIDNPIIRCLQEGRVIAASGSCLLINRAGKEVAIQDSAAPIRDRLGNIIGSVMVFHDVSSEGRLSRKLSYQASHDSLTGFINRHEFENVLERALTQIRSNPDAGFALLYIDLDQFKVVNDTFGHTAGDELIRQIATCLQTCVHTTDVVARLGGDEFGVLLHRCDEKRAQEVAEDIRATIEAYRFAWQNSVHSVRASIGIVMLDTDAAGVGALMSAADVACFAAKDMGRNRVHFYEEGDAGARHQEMHWLSRINRAMEEDRFELYFQPIVSTRNQDAEHAHYEVLLRLNDEDEGTVLPGSFIAAAERYNLMPTLDRWVVKEALAHADTGDAQSDAAYSLAINLSGNSLSDDRFLEFVKEELSTANLCRGAVCFEITETAAIANLSRVTHFMAELKKLGCLFSLDDFGSGLSSFGYLKNLPVDFLKVDGAFVKNIVNDKVDQSMVAAIHQVGEAMGIQTIAEHVESEETLQVLIKLGVPLVQGFHVGEPRSISTFSPWALGHKNSA